MIRLPRLRTLGLERKATATFFGPLTGVPAFARSASLSAIHRGLRKSQRVQYGESTSPTVPSQRRRSRDDASLTEKALEGSGSKRQQLKLLRKLKRKQEEEDGTGKQSRRKRFVDPSLDFGKKSLVYQMKYGPLKDLTSTIDEPVQPRSPQENRRKDWAIRDALAGRTRPPTPRNTIRRDREPGRPTTENDPSSNIEPRAPRRQNNRMAKTGDDAPDVAAPSPRPRRGNMMPLTIKYTTAASQFLYGKSVVKAALDQSRRKLYHLYIYAGENRRDTKDIASLSTLAKKRGVPVTMVPNEDQRLMDKMSMGRPHNGVVLEASPLPRLPVTSLGKLEETPSRLGFHVGLDHQTKEEEAINGADSYIPRSSTITPRPLVLLLNEIVDPGNLGTILRTASYFGVDAVAITNRNSSTLTPVVLKSAAGAVEEVTIFSVDSPVKFLEESRAAGWKSYAAVPPPDKKLATMHSGKFISTGDVERQNPLAENPCILVLGNEGFGLPKHVKVAADYELSVPRFMQSGCVDSLNVSVAAGLLCHAFVKEPPIGRDSQMTTKQEDLGDEDPRIDDTAGGQKEGAYMF